MVAGTNLNRRGDEIKPARGRAWAPLAVLTMTSLLAAPSVSRAADLAVAAGNPEASFNADAPALYTPEIAKLAAAAKSRRVASSDNFEESDLKTDVKEFRDKFKAVKSGEQFHQFLLDIDKKYDGMSVDLKYFSAQMRLLLPLRAIVWRLRPVFEHGGGFFGNKPAHAQLVSFVRGMAALMRVELPTDQWSAGFEFLTVPGADMKVAQQFKDMREVEKFLAVDVFRALEQATTRVEELYKGNPGKPLVWDNQINYGTGTFDDGIRRYVGHGMAEIATTLGTLAGAQHTVLIACAYDQRRLIEVGAKLGQMIGINGWTSEDVGITSQQWHDTLLKFKGRYLVLRGTDTGDLPEYGAKRMKRAFTLLQDSVNFTQAGYRALQGKGASNRMSINPVIYQAENDETFKRGLDEMSAAVTQEKHDIRSPLTGEFIQVSLQRFYGVGEPKISPPRDLMDLMPTLFEGGATELTVPGTALKYRNYFRGRSIGWDNGAWAEIIPSAKGQDAGYLATASRVIHQKFGASAVLWPILGFMK